MKLFVWIGCFLFLATPAIASSEEVFPQTDPPEEPAPRSTIPGISQQEIVLGSHQPLTGPASQFADISKSAEAYFRYVNDQGGVHGRRITYRYEDDGFQPMRTREVVRRLVLQDQVFLIFNGLGTDTHASVAGWLQSLQIPDFFVGSGDIRWTQPVKTTLFGFQPTPKVEGRVLGKYLLQHHSQERVALWYRDDPSMKQAAKHFSQLLIQQKVPLKSIMHPKLGFNLPSDVDQIKRFGAKAVVVLSASYPAIQFVKQAYQRGLSSQIYLGHDLADSRLLEWVGTNAMEGVAVLTAYPLASQTDHPGVQQHQRILKEYTPAMEVNRWTLYGQAVAEVMVAILQQSGRNLTRSHVVATAERLQQWQGSLPPPITITPDNHQAIHHLRIAQVQQGTFAMVSDWIDSQ